MASLNLADVLLGAFLGWWSFALVVVAIELRADRRAHPAVDFRYCR